MSKQTNGNYKSFAVKLSLWAQGKGLPGASPAWLTKMAHMVARSKNPKLVESFIRDYGIDYTKATRCSSDDTARQCAQKYVTLSEFFTRKLKNINIQSGDLVSPATCKVMLFDTFKGSRVWVKGKRWSAERLLQQPVSLSDYAVGIFRLRPQDYHRFHSPFRGIVEKVNSIQGGYLSVDPVVVGQRNVYTENNRVVLKISTPVYGTCYMVAVGAAGVGKVRISVMSGDTLVPGQDMGTFDFGGSTVLLLIPNAQQAAIWNQDIAAQSLRGAETFLDVGTSVGLNT